MEALKKMGPNAHWLLRIGLASVFLYHGAPKLMDMAGTAEMMGMPVFMAALVGLGEVGGGLGMILGPILKKEWLTQASGLVLGVIMIGAIALVHAKEGWNSIGAMGMEFQFTLLMTSLYFAFKGNSN